MVLVDIQVSSLPKIVNMKENFNHAVFVYAISFPVALLMIALGTLFFFLIPMNASYNVHNQMVSSLLAAPISFFAINPRGCIINRFSQDIGNLDELLPYNLVFLINSLTPMIAALVLCSTTKLVLIPVAFVGIVATYFISKFFFHAATDIKRLMSSAGSPLYSHVSNTLEGIRTIRVFQQQKWFKEKLFR